MTRPPESETELAARLIAEGWDGDDARFAAAIEHHGAGCLHDTPAEGERRPEAPSDEPEEQDLLDL